MTTPTSLPVTRRELLTSVGAAMLAGPRLGAAATRPGPATEIGICRGPEDADLARAAGVAYLEVNCGKTLRPDEPLDAVRDRLDALRTCPVPPRCANSFLPGRLQATGPKADHGPIVEYAKVVFDRAARVGIRTITFGSSGARSVPAGFDHADADLQFVSLLARLAGPATDAGILVCVEPLRQAETNYINRVSHARRLVDAVDHPSIAITADIYHMLCEEETAESIRVAGPLVRHVHVAERKDRQPPGTTDESFSAYFRALEEIAYRGRVSIECRWSDLGRQLPRAVRTIREHLASSR